MGSKTIELHTHRLLLRQWKSQDFPRFAEISADPRVMEFYPKPLTEAESFDMALKITRLIEERSWGFWAVEVEGLGEFIGYVGLHQPTYDLPFGPCVEIGWRLSSSHWGKGYATEAARESLRFAFDVLGLNEVYSFASVLNRKSWRVMQRLNMKNMNQNFAHPHLPKAHPLSEHVLYKITKEEWQGECGLS